MTKTIKENLIGYLSIAPAILLIGGVGIIPILITFTYSFQYRVLTDPLNIHFVGLDNYIKLLTDPSFWEVFKNTAVFAILSMTVELFVGLTAALFMNSAKRYVGIIRTIILIPWAIPGIIIAYMFSFMFNDQLSVINVILEGLGLIDNPITFLANKHWAMFVVVVADTWKQFPYIALMLLAGLQTIPKELYESASVDGAGTIQQFFKITLPNLKGIILIVLLFRTMGAIRIFDIIYGITGGGPANSTATLLYKAYKYIFGDMNFGLGSAMSTIITLLIMILSFVYIRTLKTED
ncbi:multiple sugar transport system permease protein [Pseudobutyrivibrio sp. JW11]|uniref:carbohydrate ABC transporter permease n=1 Tax=Pseudobutyrivibrio sp. JW11 TaxID=1855302 RepID=UPI0008F0C80D|nr:sugar ABC transporter permease [Pseudobutyrivibrio sp. JW11]SFO46661.1 multiple sugar transport system permease protein [Pseudobutyrivibrio sp. JW11]